jgi:hypothetical protein
MEIGWTDVGSGGYILVSLTLYRNIAFDYNFCTVANYFIIKNEKKSHFTVVEMFSTLPHTPYMQIITPCMQVTPFPILTIYATPFLIHNSSSMSYDNLSRVSQNVLKFYQQLTGEERRIALIFDDFHFCRSRVIGLSEH